jgi:hypothetical protein
LPPTIGRLIGCCRSVPQEKCGATFRTSMVRKVKGAALGMSWFHVRATQDQVESTN